MDNTPIAREAERYGIEGAGYSWKHNTMDWRDAAELHKKVLREVSGSMILPRHYFGFYTVPYLMGKGLTFPQIMEFLRVARGMLLESLDRVIIDSADHESELLALFGSHAVKATPGDRQIKPIYAVA